MTSPLFDQVRRLVSLIPPGKVATYGQVAQLLGHPRGARTVGWALHGLSASEARLVPWQRVVAAGGRVSTGDDASISYQRTLLEEEGVEFFEDGRIDMGRFQWDGPSLPELDALLRGEEGEGGPDAEGRAAMGSS